MDNKIQPIEIPLQEVPPPYFAPVVEQPHNYPAPYPPPAVAQPQAAYPAPYNQQPPGYPNNVAFPGQYYPQNPYPPMAQTNLDPLQGVLDRGAHSTADIGFNQSSLIVQIRGAENEIVMSTLMTTTTVSTGHYHSGDNHHQNTVSTSTITFNEPTGRNLMTCRQATNEFSVTSGNRLLGIIRGAPLTCCYCGTNLSAENSNGETYFDIVKNGSEYAFVNNGTTIATARRGVMNGNEFGVEFPASLDPSTKAMVVAVSYYLFILYFAKTGCGCTGSLSMAKYCMLITLSIFIIIMIATIVPVVIVSTSHY